MSAGSFLSRYWQKRPLFMPGALERIEPSIEANELAWLATQDDVESMLVFTRRDQEIVRYEVEDGPFAEEFLASLPRQDWTLLVHDVEKHLPDFRAIFAVVDFIPDWRIDDLMISCAAPGGGVGPHLDNYDVFLCQGEGQREWRLGDAGDCRPDELSDKLSLLQPFTGGQSHLAQSRDVLYLPPGVPHWGIARDFCMTWSIGMRAPSLAELLENAAVVQGKSVTQALDRAPAGPGTFYQDADLTIDEARPGLITEAAIRRARKNMPNDDALDDLSIATVLGCIVTKPKAWLAPETIADDEARHLIESFDRHSKLMVHGMARIAYCDAGKTRLVFANGEAREVTPAALDSFRVMCRDRCVTPSRICAGNDPGLLPWLLTRGTIDLTERPHQLPPN